MRAYSEDLRKKIVAATERGTSKAQVARLFDVSLSSIKRYTRIARQGGSLTPKKSTGRPPKIDETAKKLLEEDIKDRPAATIAERRRFLEHLTDKPSATLPCGGFCSALASLGKRGSGGGGETSS